MIVPHLPTFLMTELDVPEKEPTTDWLWHGYIARGNLTLFTSQWKAGKTTLITGLLQHLAAGGAFLDRAVAPVKVLMVSEESRATWADRVRRMPVGPHCRLMPRPYSHRPTPKQWNELVDQAGELHAAGQLDLMVIDPLAKFLPGYSESDMSSILEFLDPLQRLTESGAGVIVLHHPRKQHSEEGSSARGNGGLLAAVDIIIELARYGRLQGDETRRRLFSMSRYPATPESLIYQWDVATNLFTCLGDPHSARFKENWEQVRAILEKRDEAATPQELLADWPPEQESPAVSVLYQWLNRATKEKLVRRFGDGRKSDPYRYRLENEDDEYYDRGELPPLKDLSECI